MACKFRVGDTVEVVKTYKCGLPVGFRIGSKGKVIDVQSDAKYPYCVKNRQRSNYFNARELKLIKRKGN